MVPWWCSQIFSGEASLSLAWLKSKVNRQSLSYFGSLVSTPLFFFFISLQLTLIFPLVQGPHFAARAKAREKMLDCIQSKPSTISILTFASSSFQLASQHWAPNLTVFWPFPPNSGPRLFCSVFRPSHPPFKLSGSGSIGHFKEVECGDRLFF